MTVALVEQVREIEGAKLQRDYDAMSSEELMAYYARLREIRPANRNRIKQVESSFP
ncbi:hypothetical protein ACVWZ4_000707 [Bradyrhizobium sp. USDA 4472]